MIRYLLLLAVAVCLPVPEVRCQDPLKVAPQAYKLQFENDWVRVTRVHYAPKEKIPEHYHTELASAYVYLNDSGPVIFKHVDLPYGAITRPATKAGSFRLFKSVKEVHAVENTSDLPSDFLRIEFKTEAINENSLRGKFYTEPHPAGENFKKIQFENEQIRVSRHAIAPGKEMDESTSATEPALLVTLGTSVLNASGKAGKDKLTLEAGKTLWIAAGQQEHLLNSGDSPVELLRFEFKTKPIEMRR
ncbi:MAG TPA: hypothetical protein VKM94_16720 [Blastocatellia bacterium]|nr:hypothetical protein [Blastocatellia bacterium]